MGISHALSISRASSDDGSWSANPHALSVDQLAQEYNALGPQLLFSSWYDWSLLSAWALGVVYLVLIVRKPETLWDLHRSTSFGTPWDRTPCSNPAAI